MSIALWTVVDAGFDVEVYQSAVSVALKIEAWGLCLDPHSSKPANFGEILTHLNVAERGKFYAPGEKTFKFKVQAQYNVK